MSAMLGLEDEILTESPMETKLASQTIEVHNNEITVRKAIPKPSGSKSRIVSFFKIKFLTEKNILNLTKNARPKIQNFRNR
jgi:hypothetical protein